MNAALATVVTAPPARKRRPMLVEAERLLAQALAPLKDVMDRKDVTEIMVNSPDCVFVEDSQGMRKLDGVTLPELQLESALQAIMRLNFKEISLTMDARLEGFRVAAALPPVAVHGPMLAIRKHSDHIFTLEHYLQSGAFTILDDYDGEIGWFDQHRAELEAAAAAGGKPLATLLRAIVEARKNILVVGGTSAGKTAFAMGLLNEVPTSERIITVEDTHELTLTQPNVVQFEALPNDDPAKAITIRGLIRLCLRSRPDRIVVGELRGPEAYDFIDAMNTGHSGSICTLHANSAALGLDRLESLIRMSPTAANLPPRDMRTQIVSAIHYVIFASRAGMIRGPQEIIALDGIDDDGHYRLHTVFSRLPHQKR